MKLEKLSNTERRFAEENHNLIYGFLYQHGYSIEDFYSIVVFGYLKAVQIYHRTDIRENYKFSFIAYSYMKTEIKDHFKAENRKKRKPEESSISMDDENYHEMPDEGSAEKTIIGKLTLMDFVGKLSDQQKKIIQIKMQGYSNTEAINKLKIPSSSFYMEMKRIRHVIEAFQNQNGW